MGVHLRSIFGHSVAASNFTSQGAQHCMYWYIQTAWHLMRAIKRGAPPLRASELRLQGTHRWAQSKRADVAQQAKKSTSEMRSVRLLQSEGSQAWSHAAKERAYAFPLLYRYCDCRSPSCLRSGAHDIFRQRCLARLYRDAARARRRRSAKGRIKER